MIVILFSLTATAQPHNHFDQLAEVKFQHFTTENKLNQNSVSAIFKDHAGMLWIGTQDGLHSYNGNEYQLYLRSTTHSDSISGNYITAITQSPDGDLWVGTYNNGLNKLNLTTGKFTQINLIEGKNDQRITSIDAIGDTLWVGTHSGLFIVSLKTNKVTPIKLGNTVTPNITKVANISEHYVIVGTQKSGSFAIDSNTIVRLDIPTSSTIHTVRSTSIYSVWLAIDNQIWRYNLDTHEKTLIWTKPYSVNATNYISDFVVATPNQIWAISDNEGLYQLDFNGKKWRSIVHKHNPQKLNSISEDSINTMLLSSTGTLWLGMGHSGINFLDLKHQYFNHIFDYHSPKPRMANITRAIFRDSSSRLWIGTQGAGVKYLDNNNQFHYINDKFAKLLNIPEQQLNLVVNDIIEDRQGYIWFATNIGVAQLDKNNNLRFIEQANPKLRADKLTMSFAIDNKHRLWVATKLGLYFISENSGEMHAYNFGFQKDYSPFKYAILKVHYSGGYLWLGTMGGLVRLNPEAKKLDFLQHIKGNENSLSDNRVRDFIRTKNGDLWIATHSGIDRLTTNYGIFSFERVDVNNDHISNTIYGILEDNKNHLWLSTNSGITRYSPEDKSYISFNQYEGLQSTEYNGSATFKDANGDLWFGGINGINQFNPKDIPLKRVPPKVVLTRYTVGEQSHPILDLNTTPHINMPYEKKIICFEVGSLSFIYPGLDKFSYSLNNFETQWHQLKAGNRITYTNLPPGEYQLHVRYALGANPFGDITLTVPLSVIPPFYMTRVAYMLYVFLTVISFGILWYLQHQKKIRQKNFETSIRASEERLKLALWASGDGMWDWNIKQDKVYRTNLSLPVMINNESQLLIKNIHHEDKAQVQTLLNQHLEGRSEFFEAEYRIESETGKWIWLLDRGQVVERDSKGVPIRMAGTQRDITSRKATEKELKLSSQVLFSMNEAVVVGELDYSIRSVNPAFSRITGFNPQKMIGKPFLYLAMGKRSREFYQAVERQLLHHKHWAGELKIRTRDRKGILAWLEINQVIDNKGETSHFVAVFTDITSRKKVEEDLRVLANFDPLTGLPNRTLFHDRLNQAVTKAHRANTIVALLFLDLDRFKHINDSMGHHIGDLLLKAVASRLQNAIREGDTVARLGGDEFTIVLEGVAKTKAATVIAEKVLHSFQTPFLLDDKVLTISPSIGISLYPNDATDTTNLTKYADTAMYHAKSLGRNNFQFYTEKLNHYATRHVQLETGLKQAMQAEQLYLVYQPKYDVKTQTIVGVEALIRWESPELGIISPTEFIPLAEETGMINQIGHWAINQACSQLAQWHQQGFNQISVAVNLSARQLKADIISTVEVALAVSGLPANAVELELTESMIMGNPQDSVNILSQIKELGLSIAIDDFGTGYSSLSYLRRFPIDTLKIDREFVRDITEDPDDAAITSAIITLAHSLDLNVIAEGVETPEQLSFLKEDGCDQVQGFLLSKPLSAEECLTLLNAERLKKLTLPQH
nr:EAL domain-containing protein [Shewanella intestini]